MFSSSVAAAGDQVDSAWADSSYYRATGAAGQIATCVPSAGGGRSLFADHSLSELTASAGWRKIRQAAQLKAAMKRPFEKKKAYADEDEADEVI